MAAAADSSSAAAVTTTAGPPVALVIGASRGLGRQIALTLARAGYRVGVAAKSTHDKADGAAGAGTSGTGDGGGAGGGGSNSIAGGTVYSVAREIEAAGGVALPLPCNVLVTKEIESAVQRVRDAWGGRIDAVVYNAGAIWWDKIAATPTRRYDLLHGVNARGAYDTVQAVLPAFIAQNSGRLVLIAPPIYSRFFNGKTPYAMTKVACTVLAIGLAKELSDAESGAAVCTLWPATAVQSAVTDKLRVPLAKLRKDTIFADALLAIVQHPDPAAVNGRTLIDEDFLRETGAVTDFSVYRCDPAAEPDRMMPRVFPTLTVAEQHPDAVLGKPHQQPSKNQAHGTVAPTSTAAVATATAAAAAAAKPLQIASKL